MNLNCFEFLDAGGLAPAESHEVVQRWKRGDGRFWADLEGGEDIEKLERVFQRLGLEVFSAERLNYLGGATHVIPFPEEALVEFTTFADRACTTAVPIGYICLPRLIVTFHPDPVERITIMREHAPELKLRENSPSGLLLASLTIMAEDAGGALRELRERLVELDERMDRDPAAVSLDDILDEKEKLMKLAAVIEEQEECFDTLSDADTTALDFSGLHSARLMLQSVAGSAGRRADRLEKRIADLRQRFEMNLQEKTNHRLAMLTVLSAVFLPLTLMAGIWGMNFEHMPELHHRLAYPGALVLMLVVGLGMMVMFRVRGWFD